jgi:hypothetical protein
LKHEGRQETLLDHAPVVQNQGLRGTSAWANNWLGKDHVAHPNRPRTIDTPAVADPKLKTS